MKNYCVGFSILIYPACYYCPDLEGNIRGTTSFFCHFFCSRRATGFIANSTALLPSAYRSIVAFAQNRGFFWLLALRSPR